VTRGRAASEQGLDPLGDVVVIPPVGQIGPVAAFVDEEVLAQLIQQGGRLAALALGVEPAIEQQPLAQ
jgi:hypothetical protein